MRPGGQADNTQEALAVVADVTATNFNLRRPAHYPEAQIIALSQLVQDLTTRVTALEAKPKRGRPPKNQAAKANVDLVRAELSRQAAS